MDEHGTDGRNSDIWGLVALTWFGATAFALVSAVFGGGYGAKEMAGRMVTAVAALALLLISAAVLLRGPFARLAPRTRAAVVVGGVVATMPAWGWILSR